MNISHMQESFWHCNPQIDSAASSHFLDIHITAMWATLAVFQFFVSRRSPQSANHRSKRQAQIILPEHMTVFNSQGPGVFCQVIAKDLAG